MEFENRLGKKQHPHVWIEIIESVEIQRPFDGIPANIIVVNGIKFIEIDEYRITFPYLAICLIDFSFSLSQGDHIK